jgi:hypothetical protein
MRYLKRPGRLVALAVAACVVLLGPAASSALAQGSEYYVTFDARWCPAYTDIYANRARNDIVESLEDLGATRSTAPAVCGSTPLRGRR